MVSAAATALAVPLGWPAAAGTQLALFIIALAGFALALVVHRRSPFLTRRLVLGVSAGLLAVAVAVPPQGSKDLWAYAAYGRTVAVHHASPYVHRPAEYPGDPFVARMSPGWRNTRSVYGPAFTAVSAAGMGVVGPSPLGARLFFQLLAALAVVAALAIISRRSRDPAALACVGVNPAVISIVNGGHNDLLVGVGILAAVATVLGGRRLALGGALLGLAALVKITALLAGVGLVAWLWVRRGRRSAATVVASAGAVVVGGYLLAGGPAALGPLRDSSGYESRASVWGLGKWVVRQVGGRADAGVVASCALGVVAIVALVVVAGRLGDVDPVEAAGAGLLAYLLVAAYVLPWYVGWALPVFALAWRSRLAALALLHSGILLLVYVDRPALDPDFLHRFLHGVGTQAVPVFEVAAGTLLVVVSLRRRRSWRPAAASGPAGPEVVLPRS